MAHTLSQTSEKSLQDSLDVFLPQLQKISQDKKEGSDVLLTIAHELLSFTRALLMPGGLLNALTDPTREIKDRQKLVADVYKSIKPNKISVNIIQELVKHKWSKTVDFQDAMGAFVVYCAIGSILANKSPEEGDKILEQTQNELFAMSEMLKDVSKASHFAAEVRSLLSDPNRSFTGKTKIIDQIFGSESKNSKAVGAPTLILAKYALVSIGERRYTSALDSIIAKIGEYRHKSVVDVTTAIQMSSSQIKRLEKILSTKMNHDVQLNILVDENVYGGMKISAEGKVYDWTLLNIYNDLQRDFEVSFR
ncbi:MAG: F0F1 ATP synthase subunit delta [Candidatus Ancillula sp.]|jgi:F-type H+-transporting ATPase subunit delta|nr:F0F1 ATP synthase subunit delta [Candidatus Ancillula sp.]